MARPGRRNAVSLAQDPPLRHRLCTRVPGDQTESPVRRLTSDSATCQEIATVAGRSPVFSWSGCEGFEGFEHRLRTSARGALAATAATNHRLLATAPRLVQPVSASTSALDLSSVALSTMQRARTQRQRAGFDVQTSSVPLEGTTPTARQVEAPVRARPPRLANCVEDRPIVTNVVRAGARGTGTRLP
jgi:hypothetical protein